MESYIKKTYLLKLNCMSESYIVLCQNIVYLVIKDFVAR